MRYRRRVLGMSGIVLLTACEQMPSVPMMGHMGMGHHGHMSGGPTKTADPDALPEKDSPGAKTFTQFCQQCHALPSPSQHTASEWPAVVQRMRGNMRSMGKSMPDDSQATLIVEYLKRNGKAG